MGFFGSVKQQGHITFNGKMFLIWFYQFGQKLLHLFPELMKKNQKIIIIIPVTSLIMSLVRESNAIYAKKVGDSLNFKF